MLSKGRGRQSEKWGRRQALWGGNEGWWWGGRVSDGKCARRQKIKKGQKGNTITVAKTTSSGKDRAERHRFGL